MQSLTIWHWIIIAILIVLVAGAVTLFARAINKPRPDASSVKERSSVAPVTGPSGLGGWLVLPAIGVFVSPIVSIVTLVNSDPLEKASSGEFKKMYQAGIFLALALIVLQIYTLFLMVRRRQSFVSFYIVTAIATILYKPIEILLASVMAANIASIDFEPLLMKIVAGQDNDDITRWISTAIGLVVWMIYVTRSRRVANTFIR